MNLGSILTTIDLTPIFQVVISLIAALIAHRLIPWIKANTTAAQQNQIRAAVKIAVYAAEQVYGAAHGAEKLDYAIKWLRENGFDVDRAQVEATVYELLNDSAVSIETVNLNQSGDVTVKPLVKAK